MTRQRHAARLIPALGLALALTVPAAGFGAPSPGHGKGHGEQHQSKVEKHGKKAHGQKQHAKAKQRVRERVIVVPARPRFVQRERVIVAPRRQRVVRQPVFIVPPPRRIVRQPVYVAPPRRVIVEQRPVYVAPPRAPARGYARNDRLGRYVELEGRLTDESWECATMRGRDDRLYSLVGDLEGFDPGDRVEVAGRLMGGTGCPGTTIRLDDIRSDEGVLERIFRRDDRWDRRSSDRGDLVTLYGQIAGAGGCPVLRADDSRTYELTGNLGGYGRGDYVRVVGVSEGGSRCGVGPSLRVAEIDRQ